MSNVTKYKEDLKINKTVEIVGDGALGAVVVSGKVTHSSRKGRMSGLSFHKGLTLLTVSLVVELSPTVICPTEAAIRPTISCIVSTSA